MEDLPILKYEADIIYNVETNDATCVLGRPGTGKSTQVPQFLLNYPLICTKDKLIGITLPRRVAALGVHNRLSLELNENNKIGFHIGNEKRLDQENLIKVMTDGILLRELQGDMLLTKYSVIIIDEIQTRKAITDILCALLLQICYYRKSKGMPLKLIFLSADIEAYEFIKTLDKNISLGLVEIEGSPFKVTNHFVKTDPECFIESSLSHVKNIHISLPEGSILVFLPGKYEISKLICMLSAEKWAENLILIPLHSQLSHAQLENSLVTKGELGKRICYVSTNIAETSITLPFIKYVVDCGMVKRHIYSAQSKSYQYVVGYESKASAKQRAGRAGRTLNGHCYYLFSNQTYFSELPDVDDPEISMLPLESSILTLLAIGIPKYVELLQSLYKFHDNDYKLALTSLISMKLIDSKHNITLKGLLSASLPFSFMPSYLVASFVNESENILYSAIIFSYLYDNVPEKMNEAMQSHSRNKKSFLSDILAIVELFKNNPEHFLSDWLIDDFRITIKKCFKILHRSTTSDKKLSQLEAARFCKVLSRSFKDNIAIRAKSGSQYEILCTNQYVPCELDNYSLMRSTLPKYVVYFSTIRVGNSVKLQYLTSLDNI